MAILARMLPVSPEMADLVLKYKEHRRKAEHHTREAGVLAVGGARILAGQGWSEADIARLFNVVRQRVHQWLGGK